MVRRELVNRLLPKRSQRSVLLSFGIIANLLVAALAIFFMFQCLSIPEKQPAGELSVRTWPIMVLLTLLAFSLYNAAGAAISSLRERGIHDEEGAKESSWTDVDFKKLATAVVLILIYPLMMQIMGFALATGIFMSVFLWQGGYKHLVKTPLIVVGTTLSVLYVFVKLVYVPLPRGIGFFEMLTVGLYSLLRIW